MITRHHPSRYSPGRRGAAGTTWLWLLGGLVLLFLSAGSFTVRESEVAIVARFGDPRRLVEEPGLHFKWPAPVDSVFTIDMRTHLLDPSVMNFLTRDQKSVDVDAFVAWRVKDPQVFLTSMRDRASAEDKLDDVLRSALTEVMKRGDFDDLVSEDAGRERDLEVVRREATEAVDERCQANGYGVHIVMVGIERVMFPGDNKPSVEAAMRTDRQKDASAIRAEGEEESARIRTEAEAEYQSIISQAEANASRKKAEATAAARKRDLETRSLNPRLYDAVADHEVALEAMQGQTMVYDSNHWIMRLFEDPRSKDTGDSASSEDDQ